MANYDYKGTKITGTSTTPKKFPKSNIKKAEKGDKYFNTDTGHVYKCTEGGKASEAKWKYTQTDIAHKPSVSVSSLGAPVRVSGTHKMQATWKTPPAMVDKKKGDRATGLDIFWYLGIAGKDPKEVIHTGNESLTQSIINLNSLTIGSKTYSRSSFYPFKNKPKLNYVTVKVVSKNSKGSGASSKDTRQFKLPRKPVISPFTFNSETGELSCTITTDAGTDYLERYDTRYKMTVYYSATKKTSTIHDGSTTATSKTIKFDDANYAARAYGDYAKVTVTAWARGYKGPSEAVTRTFYIAYPAKATIKSIDTSTKTSTGKCTIYVATNSTKEHPVDRVKLEYLANSTYSEASQIPADAAWEATEIMDDANCNALAIAVAELIPDAGKYTWIRLKTYHANETVLYRYSNYMRVTDLETPAATAADDQVKIVSATAGQDGRSVVVNLVWDDGATPSTGTELSWATSENAWKSTKDPESYEFEWSDGPQTVDETTWPNSATITIKELDEGEQYFIKARRFLEDETTTYSEYSNTKTAITSEKPESVTATVDRYVAKGSSLNVYWTFSGNGIQRSWQIVLKEELAETFTGDGTTKTFTVANDVTNLVEVTINDTPTSAYTQSGRSITFTNAPASGADIEITYTADTTVLANGDGSIGSAQISSERLEAFAKNGSLTFTVQVSTGSGYVVSEEYTVTLIEKPTLAITAPATMTSQSSYSINAEASVPSDLIVIVTSQGASGQFPQGIMRQTSGDTIYSDVLIPEWETEYALSEDTEVLDKRYYEYESEEYVPVEPEGTEDPSNEGWYEETGSLSANIEMPSPLDFWDLGTYSISVVAIDRQTGLRSDEQNAEFAVAWSHQAPSIEPTETYTASADTVVNDNKNYYEYDSETQTYEVVDPVGTENPSTEGWYEVSVTEYVTLTVIDNIDDSGFHHQAVQINLTPPPNYAQTDVYDIYRVTGDGARLVGQGFPLTYTATDEYAPFGEDLSNYYRIAVRTADGDISFSDVEYVLEGEGIRIDWSGGFLEYPYGVSIADAYKKDVEIRKHLDGSIGGYWNQGIVRKGSLNTAAIKIIQKSDIDLTRQLARYTGPAFVRTREGTAFEADVQITDLSTKNIAIMTIAIDAQEIDLTDEFMLPTPFVLEDEEEER